MDGWRVRVYSVWLMDTVWVKVEGINIVIKVHYDFLVFLDAWAYFEVMIWFQSGAPDP